MIKFSLLSFIVLLTLGCEKPQNNNVIESPSVAESTSAAETLSAVVEAPAEPQAELPVVAPLNDDKKQVSTKKEPQPDLYFISTEWIDLIPKDDLDILLNPPSYIDDIAENSIDDQLNALSKNSTDEGAEARYQEALSSTRVISAVNNVAIRIPTFIVPLEFDDEQRVTQFFMVPYFGACIHQPPPAPNQTIFVDYPQGFTLESITQPYWVSGILKTSLVENDMAIAAYTMEVHDLDLYTDE